MTEKTNRRFLFICGCPRSGTTALWRLAISSPEIVMGVERFGHRFRRSLDSGHFERSRFFRMEKGDTFYDDLSVFDSYYETAEKHFDEARILGDKLPKLYEFLPMIAENFPQARILYIFRNIFDVAASYKHRANDPDDHSWHENRDVGMAIADWNMSIRCFPDSAAGLEIQPIIYEDLYSNGANLQSLIDFVGLEDPEPWNERFHKQLARSRQLEEARVRDLSADEVFGICEQADFTGYRKIIAQARAAT